MRKMISFVNFARIASICRDFNPGTLHGYFFPPSVLLKFLGGGRGGGWGGG